MRCTGRGPRFPFCPFVRGFIFVSFVRAAASMLRTAAAVSCSPPQPEVLLPEATAFREGGGSVGSPCDPLPDRSPSRTKSGGVDAAEAEPGGGWASDSAKRWREVARLRLATAGRRSTAAP